VLERRALERAIDASGRCGVTRRPHSTVTSSTSSPYTASLPVNGAVPILVGGDSDAAAQRAGRRGDGYFPFGKEPEELGRLLGVMRRTAEQAGRDPDAIELTALGSGRPEIVGRLAELGFTRMVRFLPESTSHGIDRLWEKVRGVQQAAGL
jgi:alkanesulfonate monooxygenase SsuD/methylene tetrahydromethanopterin reductase-like flavin-dependent oxidoreductase (luciferase family)